MFGDEKRENKVWVRIALFALIFVVGISLGTFFKKQDFFKIRNLEVRGVKAEIAKEVMAYAALSPDNQLFSIDLKTLKERIEKHPKVKITQVFREFPNSVKCLVQLRQEVAVLSLEHLYVVDEEAEIFERWRADSSNILPVISGLSFDGKNEVYQKKQLHFALKLIKEFNKIDINQELEEVFFDKINQEWRIRFESGLSVLFIEKDIEKRLQRFSELYFFAEKHQMSLEKVHLNQEKLTNKVAFQFTQNSEMILNEG